MCEWFVRLAGENLAVSAFVGAAWSFIVELFPQFGTWSFAAKRWALLVLCLAVPVAALFIAVYGLGCDGAVLTADSLLRAIAAGCTAFASSQIAHLRNK